MGKKCRGGCALQEADGRMRFSEGYSQSQGLGDSSVGEAFALQGERPEFSSHSTHIKKPGLVRLSCNPKAVNQPIPQADWLASLTSLVNESQLVNETNERPCQTKKPSLEKKKR